MSEGSHLAIVWQPGVVELKWRPKKPRARNFLTTLLKWPLAEQNPYVYWIQNRLIDSISDPATYMSITSVALGAGATRSHELRCCPLASRRCPLRASRLNNAHTPALLSLRRRRGRRSRHPPASGIKFKLCCACHVICSPLLDGDSSLCQRRLALVVSISRFRPIHPAPRRTSNIRGTTLGRMANFLHQLSAKTSKMFERGPIMAEKLTARDQRCGTVTLIRCVRKSRVSPNTAGPQSENDR
jgi:hypothetical protein